MTTLSLEVPNDETCAWVEPQTWTLFDMLMSLESGKLYLLMYRLGQAEIALARGAGAEEEAVLALVGFMIPRLLEDIAQQLGVRP